MASSPLPIILGIGALLLLKGKKKSAPTTIDEGSEADVGGGPAGSGGSGGSGGSTGSSGYSNVSIAKMKVIQEQLLTLGFNPGAVDGKWKAGGNTFNAVKTFQGTVGLEADGKPGPMTQAKLNQMTGSSSGDSGSGGSGSGSGQAYSEAELKAVPPFGSANEVVFNATLSDFDIGATWRYATLDKWLNGRRTSGWLATKSDGAPEFTVDKSAYDYFADAFADIAHVGSSIGLLYVGLYLMPALPVAVPVAAAATAGVSIMSLVHYNLLGNSIDDEAHMKKIEGSGALAFKRFVETQKVLVGPERIPVPIKDLKRTQAVVDFLKVVSDYIARFQSSTYT